MTKTTQARSPVNKIENKSVELILKAEKFTLGKEFIPILEELAELRKYYVLNHSKISRFESIRVSELMGQVRDYVQDRLNIMEVREFLAPSKREQDNLPYLEYEVVYHGGYSYFGQAIKDFRAQAELSQTKLGSLARVSQRYISYLEAGKRVSTKNISKSTILGVFNINPKEKLEELLRLPIRKTSPLMDETK